MSVNTLISSTSFYSYVRVGVECRHWRGCNSSCSIVIYLPMRRVKTTVVVGSVLGGAGGERIPPARHANLQHWAYYADTAPRIRGSTWRGNWGSWERRGGENTRLAQTCVYFIDVATRCLLAMYVHLVSRDLTQELFVSPVLRYLAR